MSRSGWDPVPLDINDAAEVLRRLSVIDVFLEGFMPWLEDFKASRRRNRNVDSRTA